MGGAAFERNCDRYRAGGMHFGTEVKGNNVIPELCKKRNKNLEAGASKLMCKTTTTAQSPPYLLLNLELDRISDQDWTIHNICLPRLWHDIAFVA